MNNGRWYEARGRGRLRPGRGGLALLIIMLLIACGGGADEGTPGGPLGESEVQVVCTEECAARGQCGFQEGVGDVVLLRREAPDVEGHNLAIPTGTVGMVTEVQNRQVNEVNTGAVIPVSFYRVFFQSLAVDGWVVGEWCTTR